MPLLVNGEPIDEAAIAREIEVVRGRFLQLSADQRASEGLTGANLETTAREWARENVIERTLLRQQARERGPEPPAGRLEAALAQWSNRSQPGCQLGGSLLTESEIRAEVEMELRIECLLESVTASLRPPKQKEVADYYRRNKRHFQMPEMVHAAHILKEVGESRDEQSAEAEIREVARDLEQGGRFEEIADQHSDCRGNGGDLGYFPRGHMVEAFDEVIFSLRVGEVSGIFRTPFGFHIAKVFDRRPAGLRPLPEVGEQILGELMRQKRNRAVDSYVDQLRATANIEEAPGPGGPQ